MKHFRLKSLLVSTALVTAVLFSNSAAADSVVKLRVLETTDLHVHMVDYDYYRDKPSATVGLAKVATLLKNARAEADNSLFIDNGDLIQGNPLGDYIAKRRGLKKGEIHPVYKAMNLLNYDVGNLGNHEFNYGLEFLENSLQGANFPYVSANVFKDDGDADPSNDKNYIKPYVLLDRSVKDTNGNVHQIKIGVIGFTPPQITQWDKANLDGKIVTHDIVETAERYIPEMKKKGADLIIAVPHSGLTTVTRSGMDENASYYLSKVSGIDALLFGHSHTVFPSKKYADLDGVNIEKGTINGVAAVMPGFWGSHLGMIDFTLNRSNDGKWSITDSMSSVRGIYKRDGRKKIPLVEADPAIVAAVKDEHEATIAYMREGVGTTEAPINSFFALVADDPSIQIVTNAQKWYLERILQGTEYDGLPILSAGAPFKAGGRGGPDYFTDIAKGDIALKNVADLYIYPNTVRAVLLTGAQVKEWLEMSAGQFNLIDPQKTEMQELVNTSFPTYNFDVIDGVQYKIDVTQPVRYSKKGELIAPNSHRITDLAFKGKPIDPKQKFIVATNNYRASGGGNFPGLDGSTIIVEAPDENRTVLANYILELKKVNPTADNNWSFKPINGNVKVTFTTSPKAATSIGKLPITEDGINKEGFARYRLDFK